MGPGRGAPIPGWNGSEASRKQGAGSGQQLMPRALGSADWALLSELHAGHEGSHGAPLGPALLICTDRSAEPLTGHSNRH